VLRDRKRRVLEATIPAADAAGFGGHRPPPGPPSTPPVPPPPARTSDAGPAWVCAAAGGRSGRGPSA